MMEADKKEEQQAKLSISTTGDAKNLETGKASLEKYY